jgi:uncharacterized repeat protein (TIGR02543 family)
MIGVVKMQTEKKDNKTVISIIAYSLLIILILAVIFLKGKGVNYFVVSFNSDGGTYTNAQKVKQNGKATLPTNVRKDGYELEGWYLNDSKYNFSTKVTKDITLIARWITQTYTVSFNTLDGSQITPIKVEGSKLATKPTDPTKEGYTFTGWTLNGNAFDFNTPITSNIVLQAVWEKQGTKYTVTFNSNGGSAVASQTIEAGKTATKPSNPTRNGYTFSSWQINGINYNFNTAITNNITLTASWKENTNNNNQSTGGGTYTPPATTKPTTQPAVTYTYSVEWVQDNTSVIGQYYMYIKRSDGQRVSGTIKIIYNNNASESVSVSSSGYYIVKDIVSSAYVTYPTK